MAKPEDTRCRATLDNGSQCPNEIAYDEEGDYWSVFCRAHIKEDNKARTDGAVRVVRFDHPVKEKATKATKAASKK